MSYEFYIAPEEYEMAKERGIEPTLLEKRVRTLAWTKEKALVTPPQLKNRVERRWVEMAERNGICYSTFMYRVNQLGWEQEQAATTPLADRHAQARNARGQRVKYPVEILEQAARQGISYSTFRSRVIRGWTLEEAATKPVMSASEIGQQTVEKLSIRLLKS
ncbi:hypothetical protein KIH86_03845 [Paenibacillus sp. HN-1]|uniref:hypothetical protein n=1 Tax=Paenibacillus TaxID=44249 RepID=UPI001CA8C1E6|nr:MULTISPECIES: hypothetical protein [Paenibacillus]MBY9079540.1 hypothetical protein [Paenibacillus sp. CGMCC 1.18879]MBY9083361.1 hypothetical protein [Paenibacillus sinensis]